MVVEGVAERLADDIGSLLADSCCHSQGRKRDLSTFQVLRERQWSIATSAAVEIDEGSSLGYCRLGDI